jgi:hypothetical protein
MSTAPSSTSANASAPIASAQEAETLADNVITVMDALAELVRQETELVRAGRLNAATKLAQPKGDLTHRYITDTLRLQANRRQFARWLHPGKLDGLRRHHAAFRALLEANLTVLATAHAVSEGIVRGVSGELARKALPSTYGPSGQAHTPNAKKTAQPLVVSRKL